MALEGLIAYKLQDLEPGVAHLELAPPPSERRDAIQGEFGDYIDDFHRVLVEGGLLEETEAPYLQSTDPIIRLTHCAFRGALWVPDAAREAGIIVSDGTSLYEQTVARQAYQFKRTNPYTVPLDNKLGSFAMRPIKTGPSL